MKTTMEAAEILKVSRKTVQALCKKLNFPKKGRDFILTDEQIEMIRDRPSKRRTRQGGVLE